MQFVSVGGVQPQFIKAAVVLQGVSYTEGVEESLNYTGLHYDVAISSRFFDELGTSTQNFQVSSGHHGQQAGRMLRGFKEAFIARKPDVALVDDDTNLTLAAVSLQYRGAYVEVGLCSFSMATPEESNRVLIGRVSRWTLPPTNLADDDLRRSDGPEAHTHQVFDVMLDAHDHIEHLEFSEKERRRLAHMALGCTQ